MVLFINVLSKIHNVAEAPEPALGARNNTPQNWIFNDNRMEYISVYSTNINNIELYFNIMFECTSNVLLIHVVNK